MLRRKEDMKEWQRESLKEDKIVGKKAPKAVIYDDAPDLPEIEVPVAKEEVKVEPVIETNSEKPKKSPARKKTTAKKE